MQTTSGKQLFSHPYRQRRRPAPDRSRPERLLSGQALAEAQRLSRPRLRPQVFTALLMAAELIALVVAGALAHLAVPALPVPGLLAVAEIWVGALAVLAVVRMSGGYRMWRMRLLGTSLQRMSWGLAAGLGVALAVHALSARIDGPVLVWLGLWALFAGLAMTAARALIWQRIRALTRLGLLEHRLAVVGGGPALAPTLREFDRCRAEGYRVCGFFDDRKDGRSPSVVAGHHKTGDLSDLIAFVRMAQIDTVVVAVPDLTPERQLELLATLSAVPVEVRTLASAQLVLPDRARRSRIGAVEMIELCRPPLTPWQAAQKRAFDLVTASLALALLAPVMLAVAVAVRLDSPGPILFRQKRHGFNNRPVEVWKFRTMRAEACDPSGVRAVRAQDDRVTRLGRLLRRSSIDELPQLFNVLRGEMSVVGPRPHAPGTRAGSRRFDEVVANYAARHRVKPGLTGLAQVRGLRGPTPDEELILRRVESDLEYIARWSPWLDIAIILRTPLAVLRARNAL